MNTTKQDWEGIDWSEFNRRFPHLKNYVQLKEFFKETLATREKELVDTVDEMMMRILARYSEDRPMPPKYMRVAWEDLRKALLQPVEDQKGCCEFRPARLVDQFCKVCGFREEAHKKEHE